MTDTVALLQRKSERDGRPWSSKHGGTDDESCFQTVKQHELTMVIERQGALDIAPHTQTASKGHILLSDTVISR